jgi:hypothetical protein
MTVDPQASLTFVRNNHIVKDISQHVQTLVEQQHVFVRQRRDVHVKHVDVVMPVQQFTFIKRVYAPKIIRPIYIFSET